MNISRARKPRHPCRRSKASVVFLRPQHKSWAVILSEAHSVALTKCKGPRLRSAWQTGLSEESLNTLGNTILGLLSVLIVATMSRGFSRTPSINPSTIRLDCAYYNVVLSAAWQFTALHQLGPNNVPADAEQPGGLNLVAGTEVIGCSRDGCLDLRV